METQGFRVRECRGSDMAAVARIYAHWVGHGLGTFEYTPPSETAMRERRDTLCAEGFPYFVAESERGVEGYACAGPWRPRPGYRFSCEDSVYVSPDAARKGMGRALLSKVLARSEDAGYRLMIAVIGDSGNAGSIGLHASLGFVHAGVLPAVGWKFGRWVDTVFMTRTLGAGSSTPPIALQTMISPRK